MHAVFGVELLRSDVDDKSGEIFSNYAIREIAAKTKEVPVTMDFKHELVIGKATGFKVTGGIFSVSLYCDLLIVMDKLSCALGRCPCAGGKVEETRADGKVSSFSLIEVSMALNNRDKKIGRLEISQSSRPNR